MTKTEVIYWIETDSFVHSLIPNKSDTTYGIKGTRFPYAHAPHTEKPHNPSLSRFEIFPLAQTFSKKPEPVYATQYPDFFVSYTNAFNMHTGLPNPHSVINEYFSKKLNLDPYKIQYVFPALNVSNTSVTIDYDVHIN